MQSYQHWSDPFRDSWAQERERAESEAKGAQEVSIRVRGNNPCGQLWKAMEEDGLVPKIVVFNMRLGFTDHNPY